jgi:copper chaperone CopZ
MTCESCARSVESVLKSKGIKEVKVDFSSGRALVYFE